jgi:hypothetical protein
VLPPRAEPRTDEHRVAPLRGASREADLVRAAEPGLEEVGAERDEHVGFADLELRHCGRSEHELVPAAQRLVRDDSKRTRPASRTPQRDRSGVEVPVS